MSRGNASSVLFLTAVAAFVASCKENPPKNDMNAAERSGLIPERVVHRPPMPSKPPIPLDQLEAKIEKVCPIQLAEWRRTYSYTWLHDLKRYSNEEISFSFDKGPYPDLRPSRSWRDVLEVVAIDDRRGIEVLWGHYNLRTGTVEFEVGPCSPGGS